MIIGVSQRVENKPDRNERWDCLDQAWVCLLDQTEIVPVPVPNTLINVQLWAETLKLSGFILTGGNDPGCLTLASATAPERDRTENEILKFAREKALPVMAVCRGMQMLVLFLGGKPTSLLGHIRTEHTVVFEKKLFRYPKILSVNSFHSFGIMRKDIGEELEIVATAPDGSIEACRHRSLPMLGIMWHPERNPPDLRISEFLHGFFMGKSSCE